MQENIHLQRYFRFIASRPKRPFEKNKDLEKHHIYPKSLGGLDLPGNIVVLTIREHFIAHMMLWKAYKNKSMSSAFLLMSQYGKMTSRQFEAIKNDVRRLQSGTIVSEETRRKNSESCKGRIPWNKGKKLTEEHKQKLRENHADFRGEKSPSYGKRGKDNPLYGKPRPQHVKDAVSKYMSEHNPMKGRKWTEEDREKRAFVWTEEQKAKLREGQRRRREREKLNKEIGSINAKRNSQ